MTSYTRYLVVALGVLLSVAVADAAVDCPTREDQLSHVCDRGTNDGGVCTPEYPGSPGPVCSRERESVDCPGGGCEIPFLIGPKTSFNGVLTIAVDENVSELVANPGASNVVALTVSLDLGKKGVISQTYQNLADTTQPPSDLVEPSLQVTELIVGLLDEIDSETGKARAINDLVFRGVDNEMASALLTALEAPSGKPVITKVGPLLVTDQGSTNLATVLRAKVKGGLIAP